MKNDEQEYERNENCVNIRLQKACHIAKVARVFAYPAILIHIGDNGNRTDRNTATSKMLI